MLAAAAVSLVASGCLAPSFRAGGTDPNGVFAGGTEVLALVPHGGALFASTSFWNDEPGDDPAPGAQVLRLDGAGDAWEVDVSFGPAVRRVTALREVTFTTDGAGAPLAAPVRMLVAGLAKVGGGYEVATRDPSTGAWTVQTIAAGDELTHEVRALGHLRDGAVDRLFAGFGDGTGASAKGVTSAVYDAAAPGGVRWAATPETSALAGRPLAFATANGVLHLVAGPNVYRRVPGAATWEVVHTDSATASCTGSSCAGLRGLTAISDADGTGEDLLLAGRFAASNIWRLDPENGYAATLELDVNAFLRARYGPATDASVVAYNDFVPAVDPRTGKTFHFVSLLFFPDPGPRVDARKAGFLVRGPDGRYETREVRWDPNPNGQTPEALRSTRTFAVSPFPEHQGRGYYVGGYDAFTPSHNTAWIDLGLLDAAAPTSTCLAQPPVPPPAAYTVRIADPSSLYDATRSRSIPYRVYYPSGYTGKAPVVIVAHGGTGAPLSHQNALTYLGRALAGAGYVAVHPNFTSTTPRVDRPLDVRFVLDRIGAGTLAVPGFPGTLDPARVGVAGHSWGAYTTLVVGGATTDLGGFGTDTRPKAFLGLSPQGVGQFGFTEGSWAGMTRPTYTMFGELEADGSTGQFFAEMWRRQPYEGMPGGNKFVSILPGADHDAFGNGTSANDLVTQAFVAAQAVAFFDTYVKGGPSRACEIGNLAVPAGTVTDRK